MNTSTIFKLFRLQQLSNHRIPISILSTSSFINFLLLSPQNRSHLLQIRLRHSLPLLRRRLLLRFTSVLRRRHMSIVILVGIAAVHADVIICELFPAV
ncbi:hypothetical protein HanRHA438_Chr06g0277741 [Helianthus annuus]|nr:hypothetical protein HanRHA438_Chr06g0277741 [Helianthus annuus]